MHLLLDAVHHVDRVVHPETDTHGNHGYGIDVQPHVQQAHAGIGQGGGEGHGHQHHEAGMERAVKPQGECQDQDQHRGHHDDVGLVCLFVDGRGDADGAAGQVDMQALNLAAGCVYPFLGHVDGAPYGFPGVVLVIEHHVGEPVIGVDIFLQRALGRRRHHEHEQQPADVLVDGGDHRPARVVVAGHLVHLGQQVVHPFHPAQLRVQHHVVLEIGQRLHDLRFLQSAVLVGAGDDEQFLGAREAIVDGS